MKKLLAVAALLAVGATSFAAVVKEVEQSTGHTSVALPIGVRGTLVRPTNLMLEVHAEKSAGVNGDRLEFDFTNLVIGGSAQSLEGTFVAKLLDKNGTAIKFAEAPVYSLDDRKVAFVDANVFAKPVKTVTNAANGMNSLATVKNVGLDYTLNSTKGLVGETSNKGTIVVTADPAHADEAGVFTTAELDLRVIVVNQNAAGNTKLPVLP